MKRGLEQVAVRTEKDGDGDSAQGEAEVVPNSLTINIACCLLFEKAANFLDLAPSRLCIEQEIAQLAGIRLDVDGAFGRSGVALEDEDLVLGATSLLDRVHGGRPDGLRAQFPSRWSDK